MEAEQTGRAGERGRGELYSIVTELQNGICINKAETSAGLFFYSQLQGWDEGRELVCVCVCALHACVCTPPPPVLKMMSLEHCCVKNWSSLGWWEGHGSSSPTYHTRLNPSYRSGSSTGVKLPSPLQRNLGDVAEKSLLSTQCLASVRCLLHKHEMKCSVLVPPAFKTPDLIELNYFLPSFHVEPRIDIRGSFLEPHYTVFPLTCMHCSSSCVLW